MLDFLGVNLRIQTDIINAGQNIRRKRVEDWCRWRNVMRYGEDSRYIKYNGIAYPIDYVTSKGYVHAYVRINGKRIIGVDTSREFAFYALQNHVYQEVDLENEQKE